MLQYTVDEGLMREKSLHLYTVATTAEQVLEQLSASTETVDINETKFIK
jgi:hypothetical protein